MEPTTHTPPVERSLVTEGTPDERYPLPAKPQLRAGDGVMRAHDLGTIARTLIDSDAFPFKELAGLTIAYLWAEKGGLAGGFPAFGRMSKESKLHRHFSGVDYVASLSVDHLTTIKATRWQVEALVAHQLGHIAVATTEKGEKRYGIKGHDFEGFAFEFEHYGVYLSGQVTGAQSIALAIQMGMVFEEGDDEELDGEFDPTGHLPPADEGELGPVAGGAPDATWAEPLDEEKDLDLQASPEQHLEAIRDAFGTRFLDDGTEVCLRCGVTASDHPVDICVGGPPRGFDVKRGSGAPATKAERDAMGVGQIKTYSRDELDTMGVTPETALKPNVKVSRSNGTHDADEPLIDRNRVLQTLTEIGTKIVFEDGAYRHPSGLPVYSTEWVESEFRSAISNKSLHKTR